MRTEAAISLLSTVSAQRCGVFATTTVAKRGVKSKQLTSLARAKVIERLLPGVYRLTSVRKSPQQWMHAALLWAGPKAALAGCSAGHLYGMEGVHQDIPTVVVPHNLNPRHDNVRVHRVRDMSTVMVRSFNGMRVAGVEACLTQLAAAIDEEGDDEALEIACEDARRRGLTGIRALRKYLDTRAGKGRNGVARLRALIDELDPKNPSRSTLEVKTRRLLAASDLPKFEREVPLTWRGRTRFFDFGRPDDKLVLECNSKRWHDDPADYADYNDKASVPGKLGWTIIFVTWDDITKRPDKILADIAEAVSGR